MPRFRDELDAIRPYRPGARPDELLLDLGLDGFARLASNECPHPPFPEVEQAILAVLGDLNRYPDNDAVELRADLASVLGAPIDRVLLGAGSNTLLSFTALAAGGSGTSAVFADPSFMLYPTATVIAGAEPIAVSVDAAWRHDLDAMRAAIGENTTVVYVCNPNNPTSTHVGGNDLAAFIDEVPDDVLIAVDEAYQEYATAPDFATALPLALERDNVLVYRTFSKVYGLAGLRLGYVVGHPLALDYLRRVGHPFAANTVAQAAARAALRHPDRLAERVQSNATQRKLVMDGLTSRRIAHAESQTNFVWMEADQQLYDDLMHGGVLTRRYRSGYLRVTLGTEQENRRFLARLDETDFPQRSR